MLMEQHNDDQRHKKLTPFVPLSLHSSRLAEIQYFANFIRRHALAMIYRAGSGHPGGSLSCADLLAYLCQEALAWQARRLTDFSATRDDVPRLILSKGHACPALYAAAYGMGLIDRDALGEFRRINGRLQGHPHVALTPWVEVSTGSLGQGFSYAVGRAWALRARRADAWTYVIIGDGELQEGQVWEAALCAAHNRLGRLVAVVDYNRLQSDDFNENVLALESLRDKWQAFNWHVVEIPGHDIRRIHDAVVEARRIEDRPTVVIAHTQKGYGVKFMTNQPAWHGSVKLRTREIRRALLELGATASEIEQLIGPAGSDDG